MRALKLASFAAAAVCTVSLSACGGGAAPAAAPAPSRPGGGSDGAVDGPVRLGHGRE